MVGLTVLSLNLDILASVILFAIAMGVISLSSYLVIFHPRVSLEDQKKASFLNRHLDFVIRDYERRFDPDYDVRVNS